MKGRTPPPRQLPADADERRIAAALKACEHISTEALESGLIAEALDAVGLLQTAMALAAAVAAQGKNPADYVDFARAVKQASAIAQRLAASGFNEARNREWEARTGEKLGEDLADVVLTPLRGGEKWTPATGPERRRSGPEGGSS